MDISFKVLYVNYFKKVYSTCLLILKNHYLAEEAAQEAFYKAYTKIHTLKEPSKFGPWVAAIATNCSINIYNSKKKIVNIEDENIIYYLVNESSSISDPLAELEKLELSKELKMAIAKLNPPLNQLIILKYYWDLTDKEIAEMLNMPIGSVKSSLNRARTILARTLPSINKDFLNLIEGGRAK